jgi:hypothetical protein
MPLIGANELRTALRRLVVQTDAASRTMLATIAAMVVRESKYNFEGSHKKGQPHIGGNKPNVVTGYLRRSIRMNPIARVSLGVYVTRVGPNAIYGRRVELGLNGSKGYPYFGPAVDKVHPQMHEVATKVWASYLK